MQRLLAVCVLTALLAATTVALADDTAIGTKSGVAYPIANSSIRMEAETVQATLYGSFAEYRVDFRFVNGGPPQHVKLGFPFSRRGEGEDASDHALFGFQAWQNGTPLTVTRQNGKDGVTLVGYYVHEADFPTGVTMISVKYVATPDSTAGMPEAIDPPAPFTGLQSFASGYEYWLHTGAKWQGTIGRALVRYRAADSFAGWGTEWAPPESMSNSWQTAPPGWAHPDALTWIWDFHNLEPKQPEGWNRSPSDVMLAYFDPQFRPEDGKPDPRGIVPSSVQVSSEVRDSWPESTFGGRIGGGWAAPGAGVGATARVVFSKERPVREIRVLSGNLTEPGAFERDNRPKHLKVAFSDGTSTQVNLADRAGLQRFAVNANAKWADITIVDSYVGTSPNGTHLARIEFGTQVAPDFANFGSLITNPAAVPPVAPPPSTQLSKTAVAFGFKSRGYWDFPLRIVPADSADNAAAFASSLCSRGYVAESASDVTADEALRRIRDGASVMWFMGHGTTIPASGGEYEGLAVQFADHTYLETDTSVRNLRPGSASAVRLLQDVDLSRLGLIVFGGCETGANADNEHSLLGYTTRHGVKMAVGFSRNMHYDLQMEPWADAFRKRAVEDGLDVETAAHRATQDCWTIWDAPEVIRSAPGVKRVYINEAPPKVEM